MKAKLTAGFTLVELMVSVGILIVLFAIATIILTRLPSSTSQLAIFDNLVSDLRAQQTLSMSGYNDQSYGISFDSGSYTLFPNNLTMKLDSALSFTDIKFSGAKVIFAAGSGDVENYINGEDSVSVTDSLTGEVKIIRINKYGATY